MDLKLLKKHISSYTKGIEEEHEKHIQDMAERKERKLFYILLSWMVCLMGYVNLGQ